MYALSYHSYEFVHIDRDGNEYGHSQCTAAQAEHPLWIKFDCGRKWTYVKCNEDDGKPFWMTMAKTASFLPRRAATPMPTIYTPQFFEPPTEKKDQK